MTQIKHMRADFGSLNHLSNEMCQMNTKICRIAHRQSRLCGFAPSPSPEPTKESFLLMVLMVLAFLVMIRWRTLNDAPFVIRDKKWE